MTKMKDQSTLKEESVWKNYSLPGFFCGSNKFAHKKSSPIVNHYEHSYDKNHNVIVIEGKSENRQELINSYEKITGVQNILALIEQTKDWSFANQVETITGDVSQFIGNPIEVEQKIIAAQKEATDSLAAFNKKFGTNFTSKQFLDLMNSGELNKVLQDIAKKGEQDENANS